MFADRSDAGRQLAPIVAAAGFAEPLLLALPRGGVPVAVQLAAALDAELDVLATRKIGLPWRPEQGVGAVVAGSAPFYDPELLRIAGLSEGELDPVAAREAAEAERRSVRYRGDRPPPRIAGRAVVAVDDGLATGVTMRAALAAIAAQGPARLAAAVPVCAEDAARVIERTLAPVLTVERTRRLGAVGRWYADFTQVTDAEVVAALAGPGHPR
jgi:putative phosphoribosyl transferase